MHRQIAGRLTSPVTKWIVLAAWILIFVASVGFAGKLSDVQNNEASSWLPGSAESTQALDKLAPFFDQNDIPTVVAYERDGGLTDADFAAIAQQAKKIGALDGVTGQVRFPTDAATGQQAGLVSKDGEAAQTVVTFNFGKNGWNKMPDAADDLRDIAAIDGVTVHITGSGGQAADSAEAFGGIDGTLLIATLLVVILILLFTYRSPVLWLLPILCAMVSLMTSEAVIYFLAKYADLTVNGQSQGILTVLVVGAGTDYALLLVARYREELRSHDDRHEAMAFALHRAAPAIFASASTVVVGLLCLMFAEMNSTAGLGPVNAVGVAVTFLVMVTLLPALLVICGRWMFWPLVPSFGSAEPTESGLWARVGGRIARGPRRVWVGTALALGVACLGLLHLQTDGLNSSDQYTQEFDSLKGQRVLEQHGLINDSDPIRIVTDAADATAVADAVARVPGLTPAAPPATAAGITVLSVTTPGDVAGQAALQKVADLRTALKAVPDAEALVGGTSAIYLDVENASHRDNLVIIPIVLLVVMVILMLLLRSLLSPLILMLTVVLSFGAALGISTIIFREVFTRIFDHGAGFDHTDASFPLFVFVFLVALGIDYNIFLMTRVREETIEHGDTRKASLVALSATGGVITSAGIVLAATFAVLGSLPLVFLAELGTAVALGVLLDTMIVRSVLVTAINLDLGDRIWWPSRLGRDTSAPQAPQP